MPFWIKLTMPCSIRSFHYSLEGGPVLLKDACHLAFVKEGLFWKKEDAEVCLPILMDAENEAADYVQRDLPLSFDQAHREYGFRRVSGSDSIYISNPYGKTIASRNTTEQDPLIELGEE